ncbi:MAG TPA: hypothetical protein PKV48_03855, partial [Thermodesulfobacteriota bacterium]|nr:hypothetical protein [Thermodesulfobacteriota bacterium]
TLCHDHYLSPLQASLALRGAKVLINPSMQTSRGMIKKWTVCQQARAVENEVFTFCTMHDAKKECKAGWTWGKRGNFVRGRIFGFAPDGRQVKFIPWGKPDFAPIEANLITLDQSPLWYCKIGPGSVVGSGDYDAGYTSPLRCSCKGPNLHLSAVQSGLSVGGKTLKWLPKRLVHHLKVTNIGKIQVIMVEEDVLSDPGSCWKKVVECPGKSVNRYFIWCYLSSNPSKKIRLIGQSRSLELCMPVILQDMHSGTFSAYAFANQEKHPASIEGRSEMTIPFSFVNQGGGLMYALRQPLDETDPSGQHQQRRKRFLKLIVIEAFSERKGCGKCRRS